MSAIVTDSACPACSAPLQPYATKQGIVWGCSPCGGFAANLAVLRKAAPRIFVKHLWLAAIESGIASRQLCPSCSQPLRRFGPEVEVWPSCQLCCRCFLIWFDAQALDALRVAHDDVRLLGERLALARRLPSSKPPEE